MIHIETTALFSPITLSSIYKEKNCKHSKLSLTLKYILLTLSGFFNIFHEFDRPQNSHNISINTDPWEKNLKHDFHSFSCAHSVESNVPSLKKFFSKMLPLFFSDGIAFNTPASHCFLIYVISHTIN